MGTHKKSGSGFAVLLIALGAYLILDNYYYFDATYYIFNWKSILIAFGVISLFNSGCKMFGLLMVTIGGLGHYAAYQGVSFGYMLSDLWPIFLVIIGLSILFRRPEGPRHDRKNFWNNCEDCEDDDDDDISRAKRFERTIRSGKKKKYNPTDENTIDETVIMNTSEKVFTSQNLKGGRLTCIMGGIEYDFLDADLAPGINQLEISVVFGTVEIVVPSNWKIVSKATAIFGGIDDKRKQYTISDEKEERILEINGTVIFGGLEIKGY